MSKIEDTAAPQAAVDESPESTSDELATSGDQQLIEKPRGDDRPFVKAAIPFSLMKLMLDAIGVLHEPEEVERACTAAQKDLGPATPGKRCKFIFEELKLRGVQVAQMHWRRFDQRRLPALAYVGDAWHFIESGEQEGQYLLTSDTGSRSPTTEAELSETIVLWIHRLEDKAEQVNGLSPVKNSAAKLVLSEVFRTKRWVREIAVASLLVNLLAVCTSMFAMQVYDRVVPTLAYSTLYTLAGGMVIVLGLSWALKIVRARILDSVSSEVDQAISQKVFDHVMHLQLDTRPRSLGTLAAQVGGLDLVRTFFTSGIIFALIDLPFALLFIGFIAAIGGPIAWVYILLMPVAVILGIYTQKRLKNLMLSQMMRTNDRQGMLVDAIQGTESIRASNASWRFSKDWADISGSIAGYSVQQKAISSFATNTTATLASVAYVSALVVGVGQIASGNLTMGALIACSILGGRVIAPISQAVQYLAQWQSVTQALQMVSSVLDLNTERPENKTLLMPDEVPQRIDLEEIVFSYPDSPIKHLDIPALHFKAGERVAVLGPIGSGKSTLLKVLAGLYRPAQGRIRLGNADLWEIDPSVISNYLSYLPQSVHLFKGSLRENLLMAGAASDSQLLQTCRLLGVDRIASDSPQGMDLPITEGGDGLSGGQKQLVGLARVFISRPKIWLLDEPTSSLDNASEERVIAAIEAALGPNDIFIISTHRPMLARRLANRVLVMHRGEVKADGKPEEVLRTENQQRNSEVNKAQGAAKRRGKIAGPGGNC